LCLVDAEGDLLAYRRINTWADCPHPEMSALPSGTSRLTLGQSGDERYVGPGWYDVENIGGPQGRWAGGMLTSILRILLPRQDSRMSFNAFAYSEHQVVSVRVNGQPVAQFELSDAWQTYSFDLPASVLATDEPTLIELEYAKLLSASAHYRPVSRSTSVSSGVFLVRVYGSIEQPPCGARVVQRKQRPSCVARFSSHVLYSLL
jgi:hypothetical protein